MTTLIVGCGYLGLRVGHLLGKRSQPIFGTTRTEARAERLRASGISPVIANVLDPASLHGLPKADRVLYCVGFDRTAGVSMRALYLDGLRNVLRALNGKTQRLVYVSATSVYGRNDGGWVNEDSPTDPATESGRVCLDAESIALGSEFEVVVVRYSGLYGPGRILRRAAIERGEPIVGDPEKWLNLIQIDDAASAALVALDRGLSGRTYLASDDQPLPRREFYQYVAEVLGCSPPRFQAPESGSAEAQREDSNKRVSNRRIRDELELVLAYPDCRAGLRAAIDLERSETTSRTSGPFLAC